MVRALCHASHARTAPARHVKRALRRIHDGRRLPALRVTRRSRLHVLGAFLAGMAFLALAAWLVGGLLIAPVNHAVPKPADLAVTPQAIPGPGHAIAAWWHD